MVEREYWKKAGEGVALEDYPAVDVTDVDFPPMISIAYAVCSKECGRAEYIVDGSTQICHYCGKVMFRTEVRNYVLESSH